jgi:hypothetical protein
MTQEAHEKKLRYELNLEVVTLPQARFYLNTEVLMYIATWFPTNVELENQTYSQNLVIRNVKFEDNKPVQRNLIGGFPDV